MRESVARYTAAAREQVGEQVGQWQSRVARARRSTGARYNDMRKTLLARARAIAGSVRRLPTPSAPPDRDAP